MCGLVGMVGLGVQSVDLDVFHDLVWFSAVRGPHSTGLLTVVSRNDRQAKHPTLTKKTGPSPYFIMADKAEKRSQMRDINADVFLAHCRWATVGAHTVENAHPFDTGRFISAHNGTLYDSWSYGKSGESDSQLMFEKMEKDGVIETLESMRATSAYAISMYDKVNRSVILSRNKERPLYVGISKKRDVMYWASEYGFLYSASSRHDVEMEIFSLPVGHVYFINPLKVKKGLKEPWRAVKLNPKPLEASSSKSRSASSVIDWGDWAKDTTDTTLAIRDYSLTGGSELDSDWEDGIDYNAANGSYAGRAQFFDLSQKGKEYVMTNKELEELEMARANSTTSVPVTKPKNHKGPKALKAASKRSAILENLDQLIDSKIQKVDQLFEDIKAEQLHEAAQRAIEEAQGVTATRRKSVMNQFYTEDYAENEDCCVCNRVLGKKDFMDAEGEEIDGSRYFVCKSCQDDLQNETITVNKR